MMPLNCNMFLCVCVIQLRLMMKTHAFIRENAYKILHEKKNDGMIYVFCYSYCCVGCSCARWGWNGMVWGGGTWSTAEPLMKDLPHQDHPLLSKTTWGWGGDGGLG